MKTALKKSIHISLAPYYLFYAAIIVLVMKHSFFWDTIQLASKHAHWYYDHDFRYFFLPDAIDSGHFPVFGMSLALVWKIFGRSLIVSHLFMLPFLIGMVYQTYRLSAYFFNGKWIYIAMILLLIDPTILSQSTLITPDIPLMFFMLVTFNSIIHKNNGLLIFGSAGLAVISLRGMMLCFLMAVFALFIRIINGDKKIKALLKVFLLFLPSGILSLSYVIFHYLKKGWIVYHPSSPWALSFEIVDLKGFIYNIGIYIWRLIDFGRVFIWMVLAFLLFSIKRMPVNNKFLALLCINGLLLLIFPDSMIFHKHLLAHRYLMPTYYFVALMVLYLIDQLIRSQLKKRIAVSCIVLGLISGNFWVYPDKIAVGWDSTLAHMPYYNLREKMIGYIRTHKIPVETVGSAFPNLSQFRYTDLTNDTSSFSPKDLKNQQYIFYSNVFNDFADEEIDALKQQWILEKEYRCLQVNVQLFRNPDY